MAINSKLHQWIRNSFLGKSRLFFLLRFLSRRKAAKRVLRKFVRRPLENSEEEKFLKGMRHAMVQYRWDFDEFFLYHFDELDPEARRSFVPEYEKNILCDQVNARSSQHIFDNKWMTYNTFRKYYKRQVQLLETLDDVEKVLPSLAHSEYIVKPVVSTLGKGVKKVCLSDSLASKKLQLQEFLSEYPQGCVLEEVIRQVEALACLHPQSVNTLRVHTFRCGEEVKVFKPYLRMGRGDSLVDNAGAGGIFTSVDFQTGVVTKAVDELGQSYVSHPDTKVKLIGFQIPHWQEALDLARELAMVVPENRYTGWDLALSADGWVVVEANTRAQFVFQIPEQKGFRGELESILAM
ncbi:MAG: hypothetical protein J5654_11385 [Victivallales bacterium]|nr:hypothetical protein [Victivallales bacterium]